MTEPEEVTEETGAETADEAAAAAEEEDEGEPAATE